MAKEFKIGSFARSVPKATPKKTTVAKKAAPKSTGRYEPIPLGMSKKARQYASTTGVGKTAQASRGMNIFAKENIPKGYTVQKVKLKSGNNIAVVGRTKKAAEALPKPTINKTAPRPNNPKGSTNRSSGYLNPKSAGNKVRGRTKRFGG
jgi:hypothetical protein